MFTAICKLALFSSLAMAANAFKGFTPVKDDVLEKPKAQLSTRAKSPAPVRLQQAKRAEVKSPPALNAQPQLLLARRAYEAGDFHEAVLKYESIPAGATQFLRSREELAWSYLRAGKMDRLRGILAHLNTKEVPMRFRLEGRVLSAMLYLHDCQYERTRFEIEAFQAEFKQLSKTVDKRLGASANRDYWKSLSEEMSEAILKMRFVKMELRSRLVMLERKQAVGPGAPAKNESLKVASSAQVFPMNGEIWQDEVFRARGTGNSVCAEVHKAVQ